jgi:hypothetical protein
MKFFYEDIKPILDELGLTDWFYINQKKGIVTIQIVCFCMILYQNLKLRAKF